MASAAVTLATSAAADDIIDTATSHGYAALDVVRFVTLTGGAGLSTDTAYYVSATSLGATTFRVSLTSGGAAIGFSTDITAGTVVRWEVGITHHVKVGAHHLLVMPNSYQKRAAPTFGARFATGDPDYQNLSMWQHWVQHCWVGGQGQDDWDDDAMFDTSVGVDSTNHEVLLLARDLGRGTSGWTVGGDVDRERRLFAYGGWLYAINVSGVDDTTIYRYTSSTDTWAAWVIITGRTSGAVEAFDSDLYVGTSSSSLKKYDGGAWTNISKPGSLTDTPKAMRNFRERLYVGFGRHLWRLKADDTWDGSTEFFDGQGIDEYVSMEYNLGFLYLLSKNGHIVRTDGNTAFDMFQFDGQVRGVGLKSYDGKLFATTFEWGNDEALGEGVIYQVSGSAVTELKRWGRIGRATTPGRPIVAGRKMFYGASDLFGNSTLKPGFGVAVYDAGEDAHSIWASNRDAVSYPDAGGLGKRYQVDDLIYFGGQIVCSTRGHGLFRTTMKFRDVSRYTATFDTTAAGAASGSDNAGWITSSDYDAGTPGLRKLWRKLVLHVDLPTADTSVRVSYSLDGGENWVYMGTATKTTAATRYIKSFFLQNIEGARFKYKLQLDTTDSTRSPAVRGVVVSYLPQPEPNWLWSFTAVIAEDIITLDGDEATQDVDAVREYLENAFRAQDLVYFRDIDGVQWTNTGAPGVLIRDIVTSIPYVGPASDGPLEGTIQLQLIEAVESY